MVFSLPRCFCSPGRTLGSARVCVAQCDICGTNHRRCLERRVSSDGLEAPRYDSVWVYAICRWVCWSVALRVAQFGFRVDLYWAAFWRVNPIEGIGIGGFPSSRSGLYWNETNWYENFNNFKFSNIYGYFYIYFKLLFVSHLKLLSKVEIKSSRLGRPRWSNSNSRWGISLINKIKQNKTKWKQNGKNI